MRGASHSIMDTLIEEQSRVLVVDDEVAIADLVASLLGAEGMDVVACYDPTSALALLQEQRFDLAIFDVMMPGMDGFELCTRARTLTDIPIMFLTAKDGEADHVVGFTLGADDYVTKPFKPRELVARVKARIRRFKRDGAAVGAPHGAATEGSQRADGALEARGLEVDERGHRAFLYDVPLELTPKEFSILALLMARAGEPVSTQDIYETVWDQPYDASSSNTVMVHIRHLRKKLAEVDSATAFIETAWGVGYYIARDGGSASRG